MKPGQVAVPPEAAQQRLRRRPVLGRLQPHLGVRAAPCRDLGQLRLGSRGQAFAGAGEPRCQERQGVGVGADALGQQDAGHEVGNCRQISGECAKCTRVSGGRAVWRRPGGRASGWPPRRDRAGKLFPPVAIDGGSAPAACAIWRGVARPARAISAIVRPDTTESGLVTVM